MVQPAKTPLQAPQTPANASGPATQQGACTPSESNHNDQIDRISDPRHRQNWNKETGRGFAALFETNAVGDRSYRCDFEDSERISENASPSSV
jgi:hypothetical protein